MLQKNVIHVARYFVVPNGGKYSLALIVATDIDTLKFLALHDA